MAKDANLTSIDDLYAFERSLGTYFTDLVNSTNDAIRAMNTINNSWDDAVQQQFMEQFQSALKGVKHMAEIVDEHKKYIHRKAGQLAEFRYH